MSPLIFGCMGLGGSWNPAEVLNDASRQHAATAIDTALECGIRVFDHADIYTHGRAELAFGDYLRINPGVRDQITLQSKCGIRFDDEAGPTRYDLSRAWINQSVDGIRSRLGIDQLDVLLLHRPDPLMEPAEIAETFQRLKQAGHVRAFGVSNMHVHQIAWLQSCLDEPLVANQIEVSLGHRDWLDEGVYAGNAAGRNTNFSSGTLEYCRQNNVQIQSWGALCRGAYTGREQDDATPAVVATSQLVAKLAAQHSTTPEAIVLAWLMHHPANIAPVIGTTSPQRIRACAQAGDVTLSREQWYALFVSARGERLP